MDVLVKRIGLLEIIQRYFNEIDGAIQSRLFDGIAHIDGVMRFVPLYDFNQKIRDLWLNRTYALGELCQKLGILIEINLRGLNHPWGQMHPSEFIIARLITLGAKFYVGSDSHTLMDLKAAAPRLKQLQVYLLAQDSLGRPDFL